MTYEMAFGWWADDGPLLYAYWVGLLTMQRTLNQKVRSQATMHVFTVTHAAELLFIALERY